MGDPHFERHVAAVVLPLLELGAAVGLEGHPDGPAHGRPLVDVAGIEEVERVAHVVLPAVGIERIAIIAAEALEPLVGRRRQILVLRLGDRREEILRGGAVQIGQHLGAASGSAPRPAPGSHSWDWASRSRFISKR
jgi:hypothetical protein